MRVDLMPHAYIVGPNSAGKSTVLETIGLAERCLQKARRQSPTSSILHNGQLRRVFPLPASAEDGEDPVRFDFGQDEARASVYWADEAAIHMIWPEETDGREPGFFYLEVRELSPRNAAAVREHFSPITLVPVVTPLDRVEELKSEPYIKKNDRTRLASRHFRNHLLLMRESGRWNEFKEFCRLWMPEIDLLDVSFNPSQNQLTVFYAEPGSRVPKELAWAGDGIQIWVQLLWHLFHSEGSATIVLDEPEVYLHPDLQRRLVRLLDSLSAQIIMATHSSDVIAEAPPEGVLWLDRRLGKAHRATSQKALAALSASLGSNYNLALARSMRARLVIASDCHDLRIIRLLAKQVGAANLTNEHTVSLVQLREAAGWTGTEGLGNILRDVLPPALPAVILLQAGNRPRRLNDLIGTRLKASNTEVIFWSRFELEDYLLDVEAMARASGAATEVMAWRLAETLSALGNSTRKDFASAWVAAAPDGGSQVALADAEATFDELWSDVGRRTEIVCARDVLRELNLWLEVDGYRPLTPYLIAKAIKPQALAPEVFEVLLRIDGML